MLGSLCTSLPVCWAVRRPPEARRLPAGTGQSVRAGPSDSRGASGHRSVLRRDIGSRITTRSTHTADTGLTDARQTADRPRTLGRPQLSDGRLPADSRPTADSRQTATDSRLPADSDRQQTDRRLPADSDRQQTPGRQQTNGRPTDDGLWQTAADAQTLQPTQQSVPIGVERTAGTVDTSPYKTNDRSAPSSVHATH